MDEPLLTRLRDALTPVGGVAAIALGGSRGRGKAHPASDYDIGLYYEPDAPLDAPMLRAALTPLVDNPPAAVTDIGEWGPWIIGGGWLAIGGAKVDILYRDLARVRAVIADAREGRFSMNYQPGHPHGFCSVIWMGEVATCRPLRDAHGALASLKKATDPFPLQLKQALIARFGWEVGFAIENAELAVRRGEQNHAAGCAYRALSCVAQVLFALNERYLINEKGAVAEAASFPLTLPGLSEAQAAIWRDIGAADLQQAVAALRSLSAQLRQLLKRCGSASS